MSEQEKERGKVDGEAAAETRSPEQAAESEVAAEARNPEQGVTEAVDPEQVVEPDQVASENLAGEGELDPTGRIAELEERLANTERLLAEADLRAQAEIQNMRRRLERDMANAHKFAVERFAGDVLAVADSLERGIKSLPEDDQALQPAREGLELTNKVLLDIFSKHGIEQVDPSGATFDPELHEAMTMVPVPDAAPNSVVEVLEKGYTLNGRLIRPARVVVAKPAEQQEQP